MSQNYSTVESRDSISRNFTYHPPKDDQPKRYVEMRGHAERLAFHIDDQCPPSRERSIALTKLEEVVHWANAAIARNE